MLSSLPHLAPQDAYTLWYPNQHATTTTSTSAAAAYPLAPTVDIHGANRTARSNNHSRTSAHAFRTPLSTLRADERAIESRKGCIRRFGAAWLRPPGVGKTMLGLWDEAAEREEQEAAAIREAAMLEAQAQAEAQAAGEAGLDDGERDLDAEIPDAEDDAPDDDGWVDEEDDDDDEDDDAADADNDDDDDDAVADDLLPMGEAEAEGDYADDVLSALHQQHGGDGGGVTVGMTRNLDDDVPEAGSYQHTDTEVEDDSSEEDEREREEAGAMAPAPRLRLSNGGAALGSEIYGPSPGRRGGRRSGGYGGRGGLAEN